MNSTIIGVGEIEVDPNGYYLYITLPVKKMSNDEMEYYHKKHSKVTLEVKEG